MPILENSVFVSHEDIGKFPGYQHFPYTKLYIERDNFTLDRIAYSTLWENLRFD